MISTHTEAQKLQLQMQLLYFYPILLLIGNAERLLPKVTNLTSDINQVESYEEEEQQTFGPEKIAKNLFRTKNCDICWIREEYKETRLSIIPGDSKHLWVSWKWDWFRRGPCRHIWNGCEYIWGSDQLCNPVDSVRIVIDGKPQTAIPLAIEEQSLALVEADPCLEHNISLQVPFGSEKTALTQYNSNLDLSLYSGLLQMFVKTRICLKKDNSTVNIPEPFEALRLCIITRGDQKLKRKENATSLGFNLKIVNPKKGSGRRQLKKITIPVENVVQRCIDSDSKTNNTKGMKVDLAVAIAIPVVAVAP